MTISPGDRGDHVRDLQAMLNEHGAELDEDGIFGPLTKTAVMEYQRKHGLTVDGIAGIETLTSLQRVVPVNEKKPEPLLSYNAFKLILDFEVGGGEGYYNLKLKHPTWPGGESGVTIGIGFDLGYEGTMRPWVGYLPTDVIDRLTACLGHVRYEAIKSVEAVRDIVIPWEPALTVFKTHTVPIEIERTHQAFPGLWKLPKDVQGALVSLVYNRGAGMEGDRRREMREIRDAVWAGDIPAIADALVSMKRLWPDMKGLRLRRDAEAELVRGAVA